jgi:GNAT superfamily N-acetyltransferase
MTEDYIEDVERIAVDSWGGIHVAVHRELYDLREMPCFIAVSDEKELLGYCYYRSADYACEIMAIESVKQNIGVGSALIKAVQEKAKDEGCERVYLQTTNDNAHAFRFYQRRGFSISAFRFNELDYSRKLKPTIPLLGEDDIPLLHEIEFELAL